VTPRGQNPTGAAVDADRGLVLSELFGRYPGVLVVEDDYAAAAAGAPYVSLHGASPRWAVIRSLSKMLGPDLRIAPVAGDALTISRVEGRQLLGAGWVSHLLQQTAAQLWDDAQATGLLGRQPRRAVPPPHAAGHPHHHDQPRPARRREPGRRDSRGDPSLHASTPPRRRTPGSAAPPGAAEAGPIGHKGRPSGGVRGPLAPSCGAKGPEPPETGREPCVERAARTCVSSGS